VKLARTDEFGVVRAFQSGAGRLEVDVDRVDMLTGRAAAAAATARGQDPQTDYFLVNDNPRVRTYAVSPQARVWGSIGMLPNEEPWPKPTTVTALAAFVQTARASSTLFHFETQAGQVVGIEEQYLP
jgi:hypothetical protein